MLKIVTHSLILASLWLSGFAHAEVKFVSPDAPQPHPLPFSDVTSYTFSELCVRRQEPNVSETCYGRQQPFPAIQVKMNGAFVPELPNLIGPDWNGYVEAQDSEAKAYLEEALSLSREYALLNLYTRKLEDGRTGRGFALHTYFWRTDERSPRNIFVLGTITESANGTYLLTYDGIAATSDQQPWGATRTSVNADKRKIRLGGSPAAHILNRWLVHSQVQPSSLP